jgi:hypothetical protein
MYIDDDLTENERNIQKRLREHAKEERQKGKIVKVKYQKLIIDNVTWKWDRYASKLIMDMTKNKEDKSPKN